MCPSVTRLRCAKTAERTEFLFGMESLETPDVGTEYFVLIVSIRFVFLKKYFNALENKLKYLLQLSQN